jgi:hypothetical protein
MGYYSEERPPGRTPVVITRPEDLETLHVVVQARFVGPPRNFDNGQAGWFDVHVSCAGRGATVSYAEDLGDVAGTREQREARLQRELDEMRDKYRAQYEEQGPIEIDLSDLACRLVLG